VSAVSIVPQIEFDAVVKSYGTGRLVLSGIDLTIAKGEFVTFIGPSGCGKSTVLKLISGLTPASSGAIRIDGMTPKNARETISHRPRQRGAGPGARARRVGIAQENGGCAA
jgi:NitT/TauT family transport system ATP-binding protein